MMETKKGRVSAVPPCETIKEHMRFIGMSEIEFTAKMGLTPLKTKRLLEGKVKIDFDIALRLASAIGCPIHFWLNLERAYRAKLAA